MIYKLLLLYLTCSCSTTWALVNCEALRWSKADRALLPDLDSEFSQRPGFILQSTHQGAVGTLERGVCTGWNEWHPKRMIILVCYLFTSGQCKTFGNSLIWAFSAGCVGRTDSDIYFSYISNIGSLCLKVCLARSSVLTPLWNAISPHLSCVPLPPSGNGLAPSILSSIALDITYVDLRWLGIPHCIAPELRWCLPIVKWEPAATEIITICQSDFRLV